jgi:preprotein translocase subunit YajC
MQEIFIVVLLVVVVGFMFWSSRKRKRQQQEQQTKIVPGVRVMLSFGLYGTLISINEEKVTADVEIAPGVIVTVHRQTLSRVVDEDTAEPTADADAPAAHHGVVLNGEPVADSAPEYGVRTDDPADVEAAKRKSDD